MSAPNLETLFDFETNIESAAKIFLETATGLSASSLYASLDQDNFVSPRITLNYEDAGAVDPFDTKPDGSGNVEYLKFNGTLQIAIVTDASVDNTAANHRTIRGKVRSAMLISADNWTTIPDANVSGFTITGSNDEVDATWAKDGSLVNGKVAFSVGSGDIRWTGTQWRIRWDSDTYYYSTEDTTYPWQVTSWTVGDGSGSPSFGSFTGTNVLPYYDINYMRPVGTSFDVDGDLAISTLSYQINLVIRDDAWVS